MAKKLLFYDFEVFKENWMAVIVDNDKHYVVQTKQELEDFWLDHKDDIWVGYNSNGYDRYILKSILLGMNPKTMNDYIIKQHKFGWELLNGTYKEQKALGLDKMISYDVMLRGDASLKRFEAYMGMDIEETDVDFDLDRKLTKEELELTYKYCLHDVLATREVFKLRKDEFNASLNLCRKFGLPIQNLSKTKTQLATSIIECEFEEHKDEYMFAEILPMDVFQLGKYEEPLMEWLDGLYKRALGKFKYNPSDIKQGETVVQSKKRQFDSKYYSKSNGTSLDVHNVKHIIGFGGIHSKTDKPIISKGRLLHCDIASMYPSIMIKHNLLTRNSRNPELFEDIYDKRLQYKKAGDKTNAQIFKIVINSVYGALRDKYNPALDPKIASAITTTGQFFLVDYINTLETQGIDFELIQSN